MRPSRLTLLLILSLSLPALGQEKKPQRVSASGTIKALAGNVMQVASSEGDQWQVALAPKATVSVLGTADPSFLRRGMLVRFTGTFNKKAETVEPLSSLTVFTPKPAEKRRGEAAERDPALAALAKDLFKVDDAKPDAAEEQKAPTTWTISSAGAIASVRGDKVVVRAPGGSFKIELAEDAQVSLEVADPRLARPGDKVELEGFYYRGDRTRVVAERMTIRLTEPLGEKSSEDK